MSFNAWIGTLNFRIPPAPQGRPWHRVVYRALESPKDIVGLDEGPRIEVGSTYPVVLIAEG
jgi:hypothetical protein